MKYLQWAELFLTTSHLSSSSWSKLVRDNFAEKLWCCCLDSALLEAGLVWGCRGWSLPQHFLQTIRGVRTAACHRLRIQHLLHNLIKMTVLTRASHPLWRSWQMAAAMSSTRGHNTLKRAKKWKKTKTWLFGGCGINLTHFFALFPAPLSRKPLANGLLSIFSWVI